MRGEKVERKSRDDPDVITANVLVSTQLIVLVTQWLGLVLHPLGFLHRFSAARSYWKMLKMHSASY